MGKHYHEILGSSDPELCAAYQAYLQLEYHQDSAQYQLEVTRRLASLVTTTYHRKLSAYVNRHLSVALRANGQDVVQEVFLAFFLCLLSKIGTPQQAIQNSLLALLKRMARNKIADLFRTKSPSTGLVELPPQGLVDQHSTRFMEILDHQVLDRAKREKICKRIAQQLRLQEPARQILWYRVVENETFPFISHTLQISIESAQKTMRRIKDRLLNSGDGCSRHEILR